MKSKTIERIFKNSQEHTNIFALPVYSILNVSKHCWYHFFVFCDEISSSSAVSIVAPHATLHRLLSFCPSLVKLTVVVILLMGEVYQSPDSKIRGLVDVHLDGPAAITHACKR